MARSAAATAEDPCNSSGGPMQLQLQGSDTSGLRWHLHTHIQTHLKTIKQKQGQVKKKTRFTFSSYSHTVQRIRQKSKLQIFKSGNPLNLFVLMFH